MAQNLVTQDDINQKEQKARELVKKKARISSLAAALPIPFLDIGTDMKLMNDITDEIEDVFGIDHADVVSTSDDFAVRAAVTATSMGSEFIAKRVTPYIFSKVIKGVKFKRFNIVNIISLAVGAVISYVLMKKLGDNHVDKCLQYLKEKESL